MTYAQLMRQYFDRSNALQWYWTLYVVIAGGLLAFSSLRKEPDWATGVLVSVLFGMFAYKNMGAIGESTMQRHATLKALKEISTAGLTGAEAAAIENARKTVEPTLLPPAWPGVRNFHIASDVLVVVAIWAMELRRMAYWHPGA